MFTVDASVWINADSPNETGYEASRTFIDLLYANQVTIIAPTLLMVEVSGVISRTRHDEKLALDMTSALLELPLIRWVSLDPSLAKLASDLAAKHRLRGVDAVYAAAALTYESDLMSLDHEHLTRLRSVVTTLTRFEALVKVKSSKS